MKPASKLTDQQKAAAAISAKVALTTPLTEFMDAVEARLNEYDKQAEESVVARKVKKDHS